MSIGSLFFFLINNNVYMEVFWFWIGVKNKVLIVLLVVVNIYWVFVMKGIVEGVMGERL